ncbi:hypothetical protein UlMin_015768 [Ulmus minor]
MKEIGRRVVARVEQLLLLVIIVCVAMTTAAEAAPPIAKPRCESKCGNVSIPFPFGMGSEDCYLDKWFEIECNNISHTPVLKLSQSQLLEVLSISLGNLGSDPELEVRSHISFMNCGDKKNSSKSVNLTGSPFVFSSTMNSFMAVSCGTDTVIDASSNNSIVQIGCASECSSSLQNSSRRSKTSYCDGIDCCQSNLPSQLKAFTIDFRISAEEPGQCKYAFVVDKDWFNHSRNNYASIRYMDSVPVVLNWYLNRSYWDKLQLQHFVGILRAYDCSEIYESSSTDLWNRFYCSCSTGFRGNAYLPHGCNDINECDEDPKICERKTWGRGGTCVNKYGYYDCDKSRSRKLKLVLIGVGSGLGALVLAVIAWRLFKFVKKRKAIKRREKFFKQNGGLLLQQEISSGKTNVEKTKVFNSKELEKATENFNTDRVLGQGGQGTVYKGMLTDGKIVAVKKSKIADQTKVAEFINEVVILSQINHRNVVKLLGCCLETQVPLLVYEFIPNGTLSQYIHEQNEEFPFTWEIRLRVAKEVAGALSYLHSSASFPIYHRDIKSSNILLDEKYRAKVADFGTSRTISLDQTHLTTLVYGTFGYLDPEYFQSSQFTEKSDVYSFGVVLVELLTGQKAVSITRSAEEGRSLATYFIITMEEDRLFVILDAQVMRGPKEEIVVVANLAKRCLDLSGRKRPTMKEVAMELEGIHNLERASAKELQNCEEVEYVRTGSDFHNDGRASLLQELPLLSFKSC